MIDLLKFIGEFLNILHGHPVDDAHGKGSGSELIHYDILPFYRLQCIRQITQKVIIDPRLHDSEHRRNQQQHADEQDQHPVFCNPFTQFQFRSLPFVINCMKSSVSIKKMPTEQFLSQGTELFPFIHI